MHWQAAATKPSTAVTAKLPRLIGLVGMPSNYLNAVADLKDAFTSNRWAGAIRCTHPECLALPSRRLRY